MLALSTCFVLTLHTAYPSRIRARSCVHFSAVEPPAPKGFVWASDAEETESEAVAVVKTVTVTPETIARVKMLKDEGAAVIARRAERQHASTGLRLTPIAENQITKQAKLDQSILGKHATVAETAEADTTAAAMDEEAAKQAWLAKLEHPGWGKQAAESEISELDSVADATSLGGLESAISSLADSWAKHEIGLKLRAVALLAAERIKDEISRTTKSAQQESETTENVILSANVVSTEEGGEAVDLAGQDAVAEAAAAKRAMIEATYEALRRGDATKHFTREETPPIAGVADARALALRACDMGTRDALRAVRDGAMRKRVFLSSRLHRWLRLSYLRRKLLP